MPMIPNLIERMMFLTLNQGPAPMLDVWSGPAFRAGLAACRLNIFGFLAQGGKTGTQIADALNTNAQMTLILLDTLTSLGYLRKRDAVFSNSAMTTKWLTDSGTANLTPFYLYWGAIMEQFMPNLEETIRTGEPLVNFYEWLETQPEISSYFQQGMIALAHMVADDIAKMITISQNARRILDIGGGHGTYSITLCQKHTSLEAVIFDSEQALVTGQQTISKLGVSNRITTHAGNLITDELPTGFDMALVFNVMHGFKPQGNVEMFQKIAKSLNPGGQIVIVEQVHNVTPLPLTNTVSHLLSMTYAHLLGGQVYTYEGIADWLAQTGYVDIKRKPIYKASSVLISATRPT